MASQNKEECFSCKILSICCLGGIGGYLINIGLQQKQKTKSKYSLFALGAGAIALSVGEIFDKSPFRSSDSNA